MKSLIALLFALFSVVSVARAAEPSDAWQGSATAWFRSVDRSEALVASATSRGAVDTAGRLEILQQFQAGAASLRLLVLSTIPPDSFLTASLVPVPPPPPRPGQWGNRFIRGTSVLSVSAGLLNIIAGMRGARPETRSTIGVFSGVMGGAGALFSLLRPRPAPPPFVDPNERARTTVREMLLRDSFSQTDKNLTDFADELESIGASAMDTDSARVVLARRYAGALARASTLFDIEIPNAETLARQCSEYSSFSDGARTRLSLLADHLDRVSYSWRAWRWLIGRSQRSAIGFLALVERP